MSATSKRLTRNARLVIACVAVLIGMTGMAFAAVPLYHKFCEVTGFDGTTRRGTAAPAKDQVLDQQVTVRFDANVRDMPWTFAPSQIDQTVKIGAQNVAFYKVTNTSDHAVTGQATFNVVPEVAANHFVKLQCFCFSEQTIGPHQSVEFPVVYYVDPKFASDPETKRTKEITLSYTFFQTKDQPSPQAAAKSPSPGLGEPPRAGL